MGITFVLLMGVLLAGVHFMNRNDYEDGFEEYDEEARHRAKREKWSRTDCFTDIKGRFR
jgi:hypothetical protein